MNFGVQSTPVLGFLAMTAHMADPNKDIYDKLDELEGRIEMLEAGQGME